MIDDPLDAADLCWDAPPIPRPEWVSLDLLDAALTFDELIAYTGGLQAESESLRITLHEALHALEMVTRQRDRLRIAIRGRR